MSVVFPCLSQKITSEQLGLLLDVVRPKGISAEEAILFLHRLEPELWLLWKDGMFHLAGRWNIILPFQKELAGIGLFFEGDQFPHIHPQSKVLISPSSFHFAGCEVVSQSIGSPGGCCRAARVKESRIDCFCSLPRTSGWGEMNKGVPLPASNCIHCLFFSQGTSFVSPTQSPSAA